MLRNRAEKSHDTVATALADYHSRFENWPAEVSTVLARAVFLREVADALPARKMQKSIGQCVRNLWEHAHEAAPSVKKPRQPKSGADVQTRGKALAAIKSIENWCRAQLPADFPYELDNYERKPDWWMIPNSVTASSDLFWRDIYPGWWPTTGIRRTADLLDFLLEKREHAEASHGAYLAGRSLFKSDPAIETLELAIRNATEWLHRRGFRGYPDETGSDGGFRGLTRRMRRLIEFIQTIAAATIVVELGTNELIVDGEPHRVQPHHAQMVDALVKARDSGEWFVTGPEMDNLAGCKEKNISREIRALKKRIPQLDPLITSEGTNGYRLAK